MKEIYPSAILDTDEKYKNYVEGLIDNIRRPIGKGYDVVFKGPIETRYFLDFLEETLRRFNDKNSEKSS
jgi:hypothetical protein